MPHKRNDDQLIYRELLAAKQRGLTKTALYTAVAAACRCSPPHVQNVERRVEQQRPVIMSPMAERPRMSFSERELLQNLLFQQPGFTITYDFGPKHDPTTGIRLLIRAMWGLTSWCLLLAVPGATRSIWFGIGCIVLGLASAWVALEGRHLLWEHPAYETQAQLRRIARRQHPDGPL